MGNKFLDAPLDLKWMDPHLIKYKEINDCLHSLLEGG